MALVSTSIPNMLNGISQQPPEMRLPAQGEGQVNCMPSLVDGLKKRPPSEFIKDLGTAPISAKVHKIDRDVNEKYIAIVTDGDIKVYDLDGTAKVVTTGATGFTYVDNPAPEDNIKLLSIADYTYVINTTKTVAMDAAKSADDGVSGVIYVKQGNYANDYKVVINSLEVASYTTNNGDKPDNDAKTIATNYIANQLYDSMVANLDDTVWSLAINSSSIHIKRIDGLDFELKTEDSFNGDGLKYVKKTIQRFEDLPTVAPKDFLVEIVGEVGEETDNYFVKFVPHNDTDDFGEGVWTETLKGDEEYKLDADTMPHILVRNSDGTFTFKTAEWGERKVGSVDTAPNPSFVGKEIRDLFLFRNRLCALSSDSVATSRAGEYFEFFPTTVTTVLDNGPIDVSANNAKVSNLRHAVEIEQSMFVFSDETQFVLTSDGPMTPESASLRVATEFSASLKARPVGVGRHIYFTSDHGDYSSVREFYVDPATESRDASNITAHVPRYLPRGIVSIIPSPDKDMLVMIGENDRSKMFIYNYYWNGNEKLQSSWGEWTSNSGDVLDAVFFGTTLYVLVTANNKLILARMETEQGYTDPDAVYLTHLDNRIEESKTSFVFNAVANESIVELPYQATANTRIVSRSDLTGTEPAEIFPVVTYSGTSITVTGDLTGKSYFVGENYEQSYTFSEQVMREGDRTTVSGRLQLLNWVVRFNSTGYFQVKVTPLGRTTRTYEYTGNTLRDVGVVVGKAELVSSSVRFPIRSRSDRVTVELVNDTFLPSRFTAAEWEANYTIRSQRI